MIECPNCKRIVEDNELVTIDTGERKMIVIPVNKVMCKSCVKEHNKKISQKR